LATGFVDGFSAVLFGDVCFSATLFGEVCFFATLFGEVCFFAIKLEIVNHGMTRIVCLLVCLFSVGFRNFADTIIFVGVVVKHNGSKATLHSIFIIDVKGITEQNHYLANLFGRRKFPLEGEFVSVVVSSHIGLFWKFARVCES
jgi:hypothetical protein